MSQGGEPPKHPLPVKKTESRPSARVGTPPPPRPQPEESYETPSGKTKLTVYFKPPTARMSRGLRAGDDDDVQIIDEVIEGMEHDGAGAGVEASGETSGQSPLNISSDEFSFEIEPLGRQLPSDGILVSPGTQIRVVKMTDEVYIPGTYTCYQAGVSVGPHDFPWLTDENRESTAKDAIYKGYAHRAIREEVYAQERKTLVTRNHKIADSRRAGDYNLECRARREYLNKLQCTAENLNRNYRDGRAPAQRTNNLARAYEPKVPIDYVPNIKSTGGFVMDVYSDGVYPWSSEQLTKIPADFDTCNDECHDLQGLLPRLYRTQPRPGNSQEWYVFFPSSRKVGQDPGYDYRTAIFFTNALSVLAFKERATYKAYNVELYEIHFDDAEMMAKQMTNLRYLVDYLHKEIEGFIKLYYIKRYQLHILRELRENYIPGTEMHVATTFCGLSMTLGRSRSKIVNAYETNTATIRPAEVELPQFGVMIPALAYQAIRNVGGIGVDLRQLVAVWVKYRVLEHDHHLNLQYHVLASCKPADSQTRVGEIKSYSHNVRMVGIAKDDGHGTAMRREWVHNGPTFPDPFNETTVRVKARGMGVDLAYWRFPHDTSYEHWDTQIKIMLGTRYVDLQHTTPPEDWGWASNIGLFLRHDWWEWQRLRLV